MNVKGFIQGNSREVKDVFYLIILQGLNFVAPILVFPYLMVTLGAEKFGYISFSLAVCQYLMLIVDFGFNLSATKRIALAKDNQDDIDRIFSSTMRAKLWLLALSFAILTVIALIPQFRVYRETMFVMFTIVIANTFSFFWLFQGLGKVRTISIVNTFTKLSVLPLTFIFVKESSDYIQAAFIQSMVYVVSAVITIIIILRKKLAKYVPLDVREATDALKDSFPLFLSTAATSMYTACFIIVLGYFALPSEVGQYAAVDKIMRALSSLILLPVLQAFYPTISAMSDSRREEAKLIVKKLFVVEVIGMTALGVAMYFCSPIVIRLLGSEYDGAEPIFKIMSAAPIFIGMGGVLAQLVLLALGNENSKRRYRNTYLTAGAVALITVFIATPFFHAEGTAMSLLFTEFTVFVLMAYSAILQRKEL